MLCKVIILWIILSLLLVKAGALGYDGGDTFLHDAGLLVPRIQAVVALVAFVRQTARTLLAAGPFAKSRLDTTLGSRHALERTTLAYLEMERNSSGTQFHGSCNTGINLIR